MGNSDAQKVNLGGKKNRKVSRHLHQWDLWAARLQAKCLKAEKEHAIVGHPAF